MPTPVQLAARHLKLTFWGGMVLVLPLSIVAAFSMEGGLSWPIELSAGLRVVRTALGVMGVLVLWAGLPALLAGWLRLRPMRWLFRLPQLYTTRSGWLIGVGCTLLFSMGTILLGALLLYILVGGRIQLLVWLQLCTGFSLPWLVASLWATWRVLRPSAEVA